MLKGVLNGAVPFLQIQTKLFNLAGTIATEVESEVEWVRPIFYKSKRSFSTSQEQVQPRLKARLNGSVPLFTGPTAIFNLVGFGVLKF